MLIDTTLREGAQLFGAYFSLEMKKTIVQGLLHAGIEEIELGWVGQEGLAEFVSTIAPKSAATKLSVWSPCREEDIRLAASLGLDRINIGVPASDEHIHGRLKMQREELLERVIRTLLLAKILNIPYVSVGLEDISRADLDFALTIARTAQEMGASRVRLSDSLGLWSPRDAAQTVALFRNALTLDIAVHCHDDFGMATGNAVAALMNGADYADCSVLGIGERSGIAASEEMVAYLALKEGSHGYRTDGLRALCAFVSQAANIQMPRTKAVAGEDIFSCESGLHAHAVSKSPELFEPYDPASIGADRCIAIGGKSGRAAVAHAMDTIGLPVQHHELTNLVEAVRSLSWELERPLTEDELVRLAEPNATKEDPCVS